jgi:NADPH:quinone reductase-like Zn-dependent oxidoreductase
MAMGEQQRISYDQILQIQPENLEASRGESKHHSRSRSFDGIEYRPSQHAWNVRQFPVEEDPIDIERRMHADQETMWDNRAVQNQKTDQPRPGDTRYERYATQSEYREARDPRPPRHKEYFEKRETPPPTAKAAPAPYRASITYFEENDQFPPMSAFNAVHNDENGKIQNIALADANESLASMLPFQDQYFYHMAYEPPQHSRTPVTNIQFAPQPFPTLPAKQALPPGSKAVTEKGNSIFSFFPIRACTPIGNLNEAVAADEGGKEKQTNGLWAYLNPNEDAHDDIEEDTSDGSSEDQSPRDTHHRRDRKTPTSFEDPRKVTKVNRYANPPQKNVIPQEPSQNALIVPQPPHSIAQISQYSQHEYDGIPPTPQNYQRRHRTKSKSRPPSTQSDDQHPFDTHPFKERNLHNISWEEVPPDPIFSPSDAKIVPKKVNRSVPSNQGTRHRSPSNDLIRQSVRGQTSSRLRKGGPSSSDNLQGLGTASTLQPRSKSTGRGTRVENFLEKLSNKKAGLLSEGKQRDKHARRRSRSRTPDGMKKRIQAPENDFFKNPFGEDQLDKIENDPDDELFEFSSDFDTSKEVQGQTPFGLDDDGACGNYDENQDEAEGQKYDGDQRIEKKLDKVRERSMKNVEKLQRLKEDMSVNRKNRALDENIDIKTIPRKNSEALDGRYMYVAYSRYDVDAQKVLQLCEHPSLPTPNTRNGELLIRIQSATVSNADCAIRRGEWGSIHLNPYIIPGTALVGRVYAPDAKKMKNNSTFSNSTPFQPGDLVLSLVYSGANARYLSVPKNQLVKVPSHLDPDKVVCLAETYLTAFQALHAGQRGGSRHRDNSMTGRSILVVGAYSALGRALIELSLAAGAEQCYALVNQPQRNKKGKNLASAPRRHFAALAKWGATPLSSDPQDWLTLIGRQIDIMVTVYDPSNLAIYNDVITGDHLKALKKDGQLTVICTHPGHDTNGDRDTFFASSSSSFHGNNQSFACHVSNRDKILSRAVWYNLYDSCNKSSGKAVAKKDLEHLICLLESGCVHPEILERFPLSKVGKAQYIAEHRRLAGHFVCQPWLTQQTLTKLD